MRLDIEWPDAGAERARAARGRLEQAAPRLAAMPFAERLAGVTRVLHDWTRADSPWRRELASTLADATAFSSGTIEEGLTSALRAWRPEALAACARRELAATVDVAGPREPSASPSPERSDSRDADGETTRLVPFGWTSVLAGGAIPMPTLLTALLPLVLGSPVLLRETRKDPVTADLIARSLAARDERLASAFAPFACEPDDHAALDVVLEAPCVVATGGDDTIRSLAERLSPSQRFVGYGHRFSIAILGRELLDDPARLERAARGLALDVARWDQLGCLSPVVAYLVGFDDAGRVALAGALDRALDVLGESMPQGELDDATRALHATERAEARMRAATGAAVLHASPQHTVVLERDPRPRPAPLHRFLRLLPVDSPEGLMEALRPFEGRLSTVALDGLEAGAAGGALASDLMRIGVSRLAAPGELQTPPIDWPRDGMPLLTPLARFSQSRFDPFWKFLTDE